MVYTKPFRLAGVTKHDAQENIKKFGCKDIGSFALFREPDNEHDPNAIRVEIAGHYLGYVTRQIAPEFASLMDEGKKLLALFVREMRVHLMRPSG